MKQKANPTNKTQKPFRGKVPQFQIRRSLFKKYLIFGLAILLTSFAALSVAMYIFVNQYWAAQKKEALMDSAKRIASTVESSYDHIPSAHALVINEDSPVGVSVINLAELIDGDIFIVDKAGVCIYCSEGEDCIHYRRSFPSEVLNQTSFGEFRSSDTMNYYPTPRYTAGVPIRGEADQGSPVVAYCYASSPTHALGMPVIFLKIFFITAGVMLVIIIIFVTTMSYSMSRPLRQMSAAAKKFAVGDFSVRVNVNSDDEIGELANAFNYMADSLSSSEAMRRSFISNVSHELKTPMTTIAGFIDGMLDGTIPPERHDHYMRIVSNEVKRLSRLVTSMLSLSRIDRGELKVHPQKFDLFSMLITILASYEQRIVARKLHITGLDDFKSIIVVADPDLMYQVIYNLIENALKFTNEGGTIHFGVEETRYDISVMITNTGPGIPPEDIRYIFDRFYKTDKSRSMDKKGMGLGLYIAKTIMRLHGGDIFVESRVDEFTTFTIRLPRDDYHLNTAAKKETNKQYVETTASNVNEQ